jgi:hypothetical protein
VGEVGDPLAVRGGSGEVPIQQVTSAAAVLGRDRGPHAPGPPDTFQAEHPHGPVNRATTHLRQAVAPQIRDHFAPPIQSLRTELTLPIRAGGPGDLADASTTWASLIVRAAGRLVRQAR